MRHGLGVSAGLMMCALAMAACDARAGVSVGAGVLEAGAGGIGGAAASSAAADQHRSPDRRYEIAEEAGELVPPEGGQADGWILRFVDGDIYGRLGSRIDLNITGGRPEPGTEYVAYRDDGELGQNIPGAGDSGRLLQNVAVLRVIKVKGPSVMAKIVVLYTPALAGDWVRLRRPLRKAYERLLAKHSSEKRAVRAVVVGVLPPTLFAGVGNIVFLNVGFRQGVLPGARLRIVAGAESKSALFGPDDDGGVLPAAPIRPLDSVDDLKSVLPTGDVGTVEVLNASADGSAAKVVDCDGIIRLGDLARRP